VKTVLRRTRLQHLPDPVPHGADQPERAHGRVRRDVFAGTQDGECASTHLREIIIEWYLCLAFGQTVDYITGRGAFAVVDRTCD
jgi:hypothetical protein